MAVGPQTFINASDDDTNLLNTIDNTHEESNMTKDLWADMPNAKILHGDCMELLRSLPDNSIDAIVTDPPYGMSGDGIMRTWADLEEGHNVKGFMGKSWDSAVPCHNFAECLRVIKPGGHMIAFSSTYRLRFGYGSTAGRMARARYASLVLFQWVPKVARYKQGDRS